MLSKKLIFALTATFLWSLSPLSFAQSSVWKISKGDQYFYLGGTVHLLSANDYPLPPEFSTAYKDSQKLIFETDIDELNTPASQQKLINAMLYKNNHQLQNDLNAETYDGLKTFLSTRHLPIENFSQFQPWAVSLLMATIEYQRLGLKPEYGVEGYFNDLAALDGKDTGHLESIDEQIRFISSMKHIEPNVLINYTLKDLESLPEFIDFLKTSWVTGDIESFTSNSMVIQMKSEFPDLYKTLVVNRNNNWMPHLMKLNSNNITEFVLVGTLHLNDIEGLLHQLKMSGHTVDQL